MELDLLRHIGRRVGNSTRRVNSGSPLFIGPYTYWVAAGLTFGEVDLSSCGLVSALMACQDEMRLTVPTPIPSTMVTPMLRFLCVIVMVICSNLAKGAPADVALPSIVAIDSESRGAPIVRPQRVRRPFRSSSYPATRVGFCMGLDPACLGAGVHLDFTGESVGFKVSVGYYALASTLRVYDEATRLYLHGEAMIMLFGLGLGGGIGWDIPLGQTQSVVLQPQIGVMTILGPFDGFVGAFPSGSISVNWGTPR